MPSITDDLMGKTPEVAKKTAEATIKALNKVKKNAKEGKEAVKGTVKGICLLMIDSAEFTVDTVMAAVKKVAFKKTSDIKYSRNNINISKLRKSGHVYQVEENILQDAMKYFDQQCKKFGIKYSAMKDTRGEDKPDYKPSYMVFFEGKDSNLILNVLQEAYKDYADDQQKAKDAEKTDRGKEDSEKQSRDRNYKKQGKDQPEKRESVKAKLAFFRDRVAARDNERDAVEKHHYRSDIQR